MRRAWRALGVALGLALALGACSDSGGDDSSDHGNGKPPEGTAAPPTSAAEVLADGSIKLYDETYTSPPIQTETGHVYFIHFAWSTPDEQGDAPSASFPGCDVELVDSMFKRPAATRMVNLFEATGCTAATGPLTVTAPAEIVGVAVTVTDATDLIDTDGAIEQQVAVDTADNNTGVTATLDDFSDPENVTLFFTSHGKGDEPIEDETGAMEVVAHRENGSLFSIATLYAPDPVQEPSVSWESSSSPTALAIELRAT